MTDQELHRLRARAHVHTDACYGSYEPCGEHHAHSSTCGGRDRVCRMQEDRDLVALLAEHDRMRPVVDALDKHERAYQTASTLKNAIQAYRDRRDHA